MIRKDFTQDADKPRFYSQYWIDVAAGRTASTSESLDADEGDLSDDFDAAPVAAAPVETKPAPRPKAQERKPEPSRPLTSLADLANIDLLMNRSAEMDEDAAPDIAAPGDTLDPAIVTDYSADAEPEDAEEDDFDYDEDEDEEEDTTGWGGSRRPKPTKPKPPRRDRKTF